MGLCFRFHSAPSLAVLLAVALATLLSCQHPAATSRAQSAPAAQSPTAQSQDDSAQFTALVQKGDYAGAIAMVEKSSAPPREKDGVIGVVILDGLVDPSPTTRPPYSLADGFTRMERAASAGREQSIADLRARFTTGVNYEGKNILMPPNTALASCWTEVEAGTRKPGACIEMRKRLHVP